MTEQNQTTATTRSNFESSLANYSKYVAAFAVALVVAGAGAWGYHALQEKQEAEAEEALYSYQSQMAKIEQDLFNAELENMDASKKTEVPAPERTPEIFEKNFSEIVPQYKAVIEKHKGTRAAAVASISLANKYSEYGMQEQAAGLLTQVKERAPSDILKALVSLQQSAIGTEPCGASIKEMEAITANKKLKFLWPEAYLRKAACAISENNLEQADEVIEKLNSEFAESAAAQKTEWLKRLRAVKAREGA